MGVATKYNPVSIILYFKNIFLLITLITFFSCAPTTIETIKKVEPEKESITQIDNEKSDTDEILEGIKLAKEMELTPQNIYGDGSSGLRIAKILETIDLISEKKFYE